MKQYFKLLLSRCMLRLFRMISLEARAEIGRLVNAANIHLLYSGYREKYSISETFRFNGQGILFYGEGEICCGEDSYIGEFSSIYAEAGYAVNIGSGCQISHNVRIYTTTNLADQPFNVKVKSSISGNVVINDFVWIGANVFINPGVTIGKNSIIGANAVVTKDVEPNAIYAGVPARKIKSKTTAI